jgi:nitrite reductase (NADH) small subunit
VRFAGPLYPPSSLAGDVFERADFDPTFIRHDLSHRNAPLSEGIVRGCFVACPLHGWVIDLESGKAQSPDEGNAGSIATQVVDGRVFVASWAVSSPGEWE